MTPIKSPSTPDPTLVPKTQPGQFARISTGRHNQSELHLITHCQSLLSDNKDESQKTRPRIEPNHMSDKFENKASQIPKTQAV